MSRAHPSAEVLAEYAQGSLRAGASLVVACHNHGCESCRHEVAVWECIGGVLLQDAAPQPLAIDALEQGLKRIEELGSSGNPPAKVRTPRFLDHFDVPSPLRGHDIGARRWLSPRIWFAPVRVKSETETRTYLVHATRNTTLPRHTHTGREFTAILYGSYCDDHGRFEAGDFAEADSDVAHAPSVTAAADCLCLISSDGPMQLAGLPARLIQSLAGNLY
jgi:putative transcriptional regulator